MKKRDRTRQWTLRNCGTERALQRRSIAERAQVTGIRVNAQAKLNWMTGQPAAFSTTIHTRHTRSVEFRRAQLGRLAGALQWHETRLPVALHADLRKSPMQGYTTEIGLAQAEIRHAQEHLARWAAPHRRRAPWFVAPARGWMQAEPFGVALILGPWN